MATTEADGVPPQPIADNLCGAEPHSFLSLLGSGGSAPHIFGRHIHIGLHELRGHQFYCMPKGSQLPGPMVRAATGLHTDQTGCKVSEKCKDLGPLEGLPEDYLAPAIHPMNRTAFTRSTPAVLTFIVASFLSVVRHTLRFGTSDAG